MSPRVSYVVEVARRSGTDAGRWRPAKAYVSKAAAEKYADKIESIYVFARVTRYEPTECALTLPREEVRRVEG